MNTVAAIFLGLLAFAHSFLGEQDLLRPLFKANWKLDSVPRWAAELIFRFAWHLTSIAWVAFGAILLGMDPLVAISIQSLLCATIIFFSLRGHLVWPLFLVSGLASFSALGLLSAEVGKFGLYISGATLAAASLFHVYWFFGGNFLHREALPEIEGKREFNPKIMRALTAAVAVVLAGMSILLFLQVSAPSSLSLYGSITVVSIMAIRSVGDFKYVGFTKSYRNSTFAKYDDKLFTPVISMVAIFSGFGIALA